MLGLYRTKIISINPKTLESKIRDTGLDERFINKDSWKVTKELSEPVFTNFKIEEDSVGVKTVTFNDPIGRHYLVTREKLVSASTHHDVGKYSLNDKLNYFKKRVNDKTLTLGQREYARQRLADIK